MSKYVTAAEAVQVIKSGDRVYVQAAAATPTVLTKALAERASELRDVEICHLHTEGEAPYANPELAASFHVNSFFYWFECASHVKSWKWFLYTRFLK